MQRYRDLGTSLKGKFGCKVWKITLDAGLGCPNRDGRVGTGGCIYCNARGSGTGQASSASLSEQITDAKKRLRARYKAERFIAYFQSFTNTYAPVDRLRAMYEEALADEDIVGLAIGTRPDCIDREVLDLLEEMSKQTTLWIEYGLQSIHDDTLRLINRGHTADDFRNAVRLTRERGIEIVTHVILGLPGENREMMLETARAIGGMDIQGVKLHLLYVIDGTILANMYRCGLYTPLDRDEYVAIVCDFIGYLPANIVIHRLTGDPHRDELLAPRWALDKSQNLNAIHDAMESGNIRQGMHLVQ